MGRSLVLSMVAATAITFAAGSATATTVGIDECGTVKPNGTPSVTFTLQPATLAQCVSGQNDANYIVASTTILGMTGWALHDKIDAVGGGTETDFNFATGLAAQKDVKSGTVFADISAFEFAFIALKTAKGFGAFMVSVKDTQWDWATDKGISHVSVWTKGIATPPDDNDPPDPVPLPAGGALLLTALAALGLRRRRART